MIREQSFRGESDQTIDTKGRIILPAKFREVLRQRYESTLIVTKYPDNCLIAYPVEEWEKIEAEIRNLPTGKKEVRSLKRFFISAATDCNVDRQGRILVPPSLKQFAKLEKEIVIAGCVDHFEIWNKDLYYENTQPDQDFSETEETKDIMDKLGI